MLTGFNPINQKIEYRKFIDGEIKPSKTESHNIYPRKTLENPYGVFQESDAIESLLNKIVWEK